jgi:hypothetical protein
MLAMTSLTQTDSGSTVEVPLAILLEGVSEKWGMNVLQILGRPASATVEIDGHGTILAPAIVLSQSQARHLATQIIELLGPENRGALQALIGHVAR